MQAISLYIHVPWCVKKCPYCDFNSHQLSLSVTDDRPQKDLEKAYLKAIREDFLHDKQCLPHIMQRPVATVFIGGGTPSLFSPDFYYTLFDFLRQHLHFDANCEITMEANPGTVDASYFIGYRAAGINRLSIGAQSFNNQHLLALGRIHEAHHIDTAMHVARQAGFDNINLDLMFGLPNQTKAQAMADLTHVFSLNPEHISWYQLTIEENTAFFKSPPNTPKDDTLYDIFDAGQALLAQHGYQQYEVSAYAKDDALRCRHNLNYWQFGDYLAIGAGAHGKISTTREQNPSSTEALNIQRYQKTRLPKDYLQRIGSRSCQKQLLSASDVQFEYLMNALRLKDFIITDTVFTQATGLPFSDLIDHIQQHPKPWLAACFSITSSSLQLNKAHYDKLDAVLVALSED